MDNRSWFKNAHYGMMAHWGLYSLLAGEHRGRRVQSYAEWIQSDMAIPNAEYARLAECFNPVYFDADEWIRLAKDAGMRYFVFTAKHHDGFACSAPGRIASMWRMPRLSVVMWWKNWQTPAPGMG